MSGEITKSADERAHEQAKAQYDSIREMVAALECDYDRLDELRDERDDFEPAETCPNCGKETEWQSIPNTSGEMECRHCAVIQTWAQHNPDDAEELKELEAAAGECKDADEARQRIEEDALSVEVRSGWTTPGEDMIPEEFCILLCTGGPAARIRGELDSHGEPYRAWLEYQDWGIPWREFVGTTSEVLLAYARCFVYTTG